MVGIIPALAAAVIDGDMLRRAMTLNKGFMGFLEHEGFRDIRGKLAETPQLRGERGHERLLLSVARPGQLELAAEGRAPGHRWRGTLPG